MKEEVVIDDILKRVQKPGRYSGGEWNVRKKNPAKAATKVALVFPDLYEIGMSYLGQKILYKILNDRPDILAERVFAPWPDMERELRSRKVPLFSLENRIPLFRFDIIGFSLLYELNYSNILTVLDLGQIPLRSAERDSTHPLVIAGGPAAFNPEPTSSFFDAFLLGDGEEAFLEVIEKYRAIKESGRARDEVLKELVKVEGVYVPAFYEARPTAGSSLLAVNPKTGAPDRIKKRIVSSLREVRFPEDIIVPNIQAVHDRVAVEVARGCPQRCRFCQATNVYFPFRVREPKDVFETVLRSLGSTGYEDASLTCLSLSDYPFLDNIVDCLMKELARKRVALSLSSLRPEGLSAGLARNILSVRKTGFTIVPEAGTDRLRRVINKKQDNGQILAAVENAFSLGWRVLKLYFMIGLPTEKEEDLEGIVGLLKEILQTGRKSLGTWPQINLSLSSFIPKPHTPFQWLAMEEESSLLEKQKFLRSRLKGLPMVRIKDHPVRMSLLECAFSRGDRRMGDILGLAWNAGARFDSWKDCFNSKLWDDAFASGGIERSDYLGSLDTAAALPWEHIDSGIKKTHLLRELEKAFAGERTPSCLEMPCGECLGCEDRLRITKKSWRERDEIRIDGQPQGAMDKDRPIRYLVFYSKDEGAVYLSHLDLAGVLRRTLRRAGVEAAHSAGFHPTMLLTFAPALPLGMAGRRECFEFKSLIPLEEETTLSQFNRLVPGGVMFLGMRKLEDAAPPLHRRIKSLLYSVDMKSREVEGALKGLIGERNSGCNGFDLAEKLVREFLEKEGIPFLGAAVDRERKKLVLDFPFRPEKQTRPQDIIQKVFGLENAVFLIVREAVVLEEGNSIEAIPKCAA